jgi:small acid-soluble spore protein (thioredoxin-like protein)
MECSKIFILTKENEIMRNKPDDRSDNVDRIQHNISNTIENIRLADEMIEKTDDKKSRQDLEAKNERREEALDGMRHEIREEAIDKQKGYK